MSVSYQHTVLVFLLIVYSAQAQQNNTSTTTTSQHDQSVGQLSAVDSVLASSSISPELSSAFFASFSMILVSELGDKTFFIAALMAMQNCRSVIFFAAMTALFFMTIFSSLLGLILPALIDPALTHILAICLFAFFGIKMLVEAYQMKTEHLKDEMNEVEKELHQQQLIADVNDDVEANDPSMTRPAKSTYLHYLIGGFVTPIFLQCLTMTLLAEWGDRSQIATIALAAARNPIVVIIGATLGHTVCTFLAVVGGSLLASRINERTVSIVGGCLFLLFAIHGSVAET